MNISAIIKSIVLGVCGVALFWILVTCLESVTRVDAGEIVVVQNNFTGHMSVYTTPGWCLTPVSKVTTYKKSFQYWFSKAGDQGNTHDESIPIRFMDGATGTISGGVRIDLPVDDASVLAINSTFGSQEAVEQQLIRTVVEKAVNMTGPLMSSKESYADKRADLISDIEDQAKLGVYKTTTTENTVTDDQTKETKQVKLVQIVRDDKGLAERQEESPLTRFNIKMYNLALNGVDYSPAVEDQIKAQQEATQAVQTSAAMAKKSQQDAITAEATGQANAATAKWAQETENAKIVAVQEGLAKAAEFTKQAAALQKDAVILAAEGEAQAKKLRTEANNNLDQRLQAWVDVNKAYADAFSQMKVPVVPATIFGSGTGGTETSANEIMQMMAVNNAKQLGLNMSFSGPADTTSTTTLPTTATVTK